MTLRLEQIDPRRLHQYWDTVESGIQECAHHDKTNVWLLDVYASIRNGACYLYIGYTEQGYAGFLLLQPVYDPWDGELRFHIWYVYNCGGVDVLREGAEQVAEIARRAGATRLTLRADAMSYERLCRGLGFTLREIELEKDLSHG